ncbi:hypothetical protein QPX33_10295 [Corynebacterium propinquum]|uniref:hypothetical protein n=1 Tax=Corynebacterium propinquum TaxID=43769 RepID=UPI00254289AD|nr:hypothetical protein [Corynebacterium propinquum]MDK4303825.1 hypothetical protein [Corynebacterium propinquum]
MSWLCLVVAVVVFIVAVLTGTHSGTSASHLAISPNGQLSDSRAIDATAQEYSAAYNSEGSSAQRNSRDSGGKRSELTADSNILRPTKIDFVENQQGSQFTLYRFSDNSKLGSTSDRMARPALSLAKLFIAEYVLDNGTPDEKELVAAMITESSDAAADQLWALYPEAIDEIAKDYRLFSTRAGDRWGFSVTSTYDVVSFIAQLKDEDPKHPLLEMMKRTVPVAADGYEQDFGTAKLPGVQGSKWGWSDDRTLHSSVSFGKDFVAAAAITGSADDLSEIAEKQFISYLK